MHFFHYILFLFLLIQGILNDCLDYDPSSSLCDLCSYNFYLNSSENFQIIQGFSPNLCLLKNPGTLSLKLYVSSDQTCDNSKSICDGSSSYPFNDIFNAFDLIMNDTKQYMSANVIHYLPFRHKSSFSI